MFERLTKRCDLGLDEFEEICFINPDDVDGMYTLDEIVDAGRYETRLAIAERLAAYEDSGLSPEDCAAYAKGEAEKRIVVFESYEHMQEIRELIQAKADGRLVVLDDNLAISMCAGARAIETNINRMGKVYVYDVYKGEPTIPYLEAARTLRETAEKMIAEVVE